MGKLLESNTLPHVFEILGFEFLGDYTPFKLAFRFLT